MMGRYRQAGVAHITVSAEVLGQPFQQTLDVDFPATNTDNPEIERMWAFQQVQELMNASRLSGDNQRHIEKIVNLCEGYSIVSEYASFIVLENDAEYARWSIQRRNASRAGRDRAAQAALRAELQRLREDALANLGPTTEKLVSTNAAQAMPEPAASHSSPAVPANNNSSTPGDLNFGPTVRSSDYRGGGGGAIDPFTATLAAAAAGASAWAARRRQPKC